ncbi:hypothetical protein D3C73_1666100 [compost metagenome]
MFAQAVAGQAVEQAVGVLLAATGARQWRQQRISAGQYQDVLVALLHQQGA